MWALRRKYLALLGMPLIKKLLADCSVLSLVSAWRIPMHLLQIEYEIPRKGSWVQFLVWAGRCYLGGSETSGEWGLAGGSTSLRTCVLCQTSLYLTLSAGWTVTVDALVITFCLILGPELIELRTMHWDIWNCELRKLLLPFKFFCSESLEQELSLADKVTNTFWLKCTSSKNYSHIISVHEVLWKTISSFFLMAKTQRENRK